MMLAGFFADAQTANLDKNLYKEYLGQKNK